MTFSYNSVALAGRARVFKYLLSAAIIVAASEVAKRTDKIGALIGALPLVALLTMIWLHVERQGSQKVGDYAYYTFWYVLPTLPMFLPRSSASTTTPTRC